MALADLTACFLAKSNERTTEVTQGLESGAIAVEGRGVVPVACLVISSSVTRWCLGVLAGYEMVTHVAFPQGQTVKVRRVATWGYLATAATRRVAVIFGLLACALVRGAANVQRLTSLTWVAVVAATTAVVLTDARLLHWGSKQLGGWSWRTATA
ncbi:uncharacterized protein J7T54_002842 [Emericellopsis cladophorae]|uniref:Uncharacterized protein n=1 Tax=Emericellopsis cladophorae TaxID=2686198 RepID=A0A9P9XU44_9HYPO|nr:uncharacterized protein J7T54_002842 [Emericellopsis cladophorae]KAI6777806.1 hypothetical protein J7T54_002842 [Emericellopsis cladophorae]